MQVLKNFYQLIQSAFQDTLLGEKKKLAKGYVKYAIFCTRKNWGIKHIHMSAYFCKRKQKKKPETSEVDYLQWQRDGVGKQNKTIPRITVQ